MANWIFQYDTASLGVVINRLTFTQVFNVPKTIIPGQTGVALQTPRKLERKISMRGRVNGANTTSVRDSINSLQAILYGEAVQKKLKLHDDRHINTNLIRFDHTWLPGVGASALDIRADFIADHPYFIDDSSFTNLETPTVATFSFTIINTGTAIAPLEYQFIPTNSSFTRVTITNNTNSKAFTITRVTSPNDKITLNTASHTIVSSDGTDIVPNFTGEFPEFGIGSNSLVFTGSACDIRATWNPRYDQ